MEQMYKGIPFSPTATLTANISATDTIIPVSDVDAFPDAPSIATIGTDTTAETIIYTAKTATALTGCTRGVEGTAKDWQTDEIIGRNFTAKDHADMVKNIEELDNKKLDATFKVDVVNTTNTTVGGKALDARQNNPNIAGTLAQKVDSNTQQINVCFKTVDASHYGSTYEFARNIKNGTAVYAGFRWSDVPFDNNWWGDVWTITGASTTVYIKSNTRSTIYYRVLDETGWIGDWQQIVTTVTLNNALAINNLTQV